MGERDRGHMVYVRKISKRFVYVFDPAKGKKRYEKREFERIWSGIFGVLEGKERGSGEMAEAVCPPFLGIFSPLFMTFLNILGETSLLFGFYFFYKEGNILLPSLSFIAFGLASLSSHAFLMSVSKKLDKKYLPRTYSESKERMEESYKRYHFYKRYILSDVPNAISSFIGALALAFLLSANNPFFLFPVFSSLFLYFLSAFLFKRRFESKESRLEKLEASFKDGMNEERSIASLKEIGDISSSFARDIEYERIVISVGLLSSNLLSLLAQKEVSLNFYLFHLFALFGIYMLFKKAFDPLFLKKEFLIARGHYVQYLSQTRTK